MIEIINDVAEQNEFKIAEINVGQRNYVHVLVSALPKLSVSLIVKLLNGTTARKLLLEFPEIKQKLWNGYLWNPGFYCESVGRVHQSVIQQYIQDQDKK